MIIVSSKQKKIIEKVLGKPSKFMKKVQEQMAKDFCHEFYKELGMKKITNVKQVCRLAKEGKSITVLFGKRLERKFKTSAAFLQNWQAHLLQRYIDNKQLYFNPKKDDRKK